MFEGLTIGTIGFLAGIFFSCFFFVHCESVWHSCVSRNGKRSSNHKRRKLAGFSLFPFAGGPMSTLVQGSLMEDLPSISVLDS